MYDKLTELISNGELNEALYEFQEEFLHIDERSPKDAARLCVLEGTLWEMLCDPVSEFDAITRGLVYDPDNYELYYMLCLYYRNLNLNKAYLCGEMALFCCDEPADKKVIEDELFSISEDPACTVRNTSIVILSYNDYELMQKNLEAIEATLPKKSFEVVVVDNASTDERIVPFLRKKQSTAPYPFKLIENSENMGFSKGCNIGVMEAEPDNDIFFLNNDAVLLKGSLFYLRLALYDSRRVGAAGAMSNSASLQEIDEKDILTFAGRQDLMRKSEGEPMWHKKTDPGTAIEIFSSFAGTRNVPRKNPYIKTFRLTGFALLLSREAVRVIAPDMKVFDESFSPAYFEDDDLGIRVARAGFDQYICTNSLIYHNGGGGTFGKDDQMEESRRKFVDKWGFDIWGYSLPRTVSADRAMDFARKSGQKLRVIDFTCGFGATAAYIKNRMPDAFVAGVCATAFEAGIAAHIADDVSFGDMNTMKLPWKRHTFDVVLTEEGLISRGRISECLRAGGICIEEDF